MSYEASTEKLVKTLQRTNYLLGKRQAFLRGVLGGLGATIGVTLILGLAIWILNELQYIPVVGDIAKPASEIIKQSVPNPIN